MDELLLSDPTARRVARFFADLMLTILGDDHSQRVPPAEAAESISSLWGSQAVAGDPAGTEQRAVTLVHGVGALAIAGRGGPVPPTRRGCR